ncbi:MAG: hypothetical protein HQM15_05350 [Deltaproteobacteria bacterium]|nr:hypothetical protein [Deltaproteobacteria bacterium]
MPFFLLFFFFLLVGNAQAQPLAQPIKPLEAPFKKFDTPSLAPDPDAKQSICSGKLNEAFYSTLGLYSEEDLYCARRKNDSVRCLNFNYLKLVALRDLLRSITCEAGTPFRMPENASSDYAPLICSEVLTLNQLYLEKTTACKK